MKHMVIKGLVLVLAISIYFNATQFFENKTLMDKQELQQEAITSLENQIDNLEVIIQNQNTDEEIDSCVKLYEITIVVIDDDFSQRFTHCTNKVLLGDALDEVLDVLNIEFDPRYDKSSPFGRMVVSFYNHGIEFGEYYQILIDDVYSSYGIDFIELEEGSIYEFSIVGWD